MGRTRGVARRKDLTRRGDGGGGGESSLEEDVREEGEKNEEHDSA